VDDYYLILTNVLKLRGFIRCIFKSNTGKKLSLDFSDKFGQYRSFRSDIGGKYEMGFYNGYKD